MRRLPAVLLTDGFDIKFTEKDMSKRLIDKMVDRFLGWRLPKDFCPDAGVSFKPTKPYEGDGFGNSWWPIGTNLLTADQARQMIEHLLGDEMKPLTEQQAIGIANREVREVGEAVGGNAVIAFVKAVEAKHGI